VRAAHTYGDITHAEEGGRGATEERGGGGRRGGSPPLRDGVAPHSLYFTLNSRVSTEPDVLGRPIYSGAQPPRLARRATMRNRGVGRGKESEVRGRRPGRAMRGARESAGYLSCSSLSSPVHSRAQLAHRRRIKRER